MFQSEMLDYFRSHLNNIKHNYILALEQNDPEGVHDLRVELKRMKAFFNLVEALNPDFHARENFKEFRKISKKTNRLRDSQVQYKLLENVKTSLNADVNGYEQFLKKMETENHEALRIFSEHNPLNQLKKSKKDIKSAFKPITHIWAETKALGRLYNLLNDIILMNGNNNTGNTKLHKVRILAKELHYTFEILQQSFHLFPEGDEFVNHISRVHKILGKWHDCEVGIAYVTEFLENGGKDASPELHKTLRDYFLCEKEGLRKMFSPAFEDFKQAASAL